MTIKRIIASCILLITASGQLVFGARFILSTPENTVYVWCPFDVQAYVDTQQQEITASDMDLVYNSELFRVENFVPGPIFPINRWLKTQTNRLRATGISYPAWFSGAGLFGTITLVPTTTSQETHIFSHIEWFGEHFTKDANLAFEGKDYLSDSNDLGLSIWYGYCHNTSSADSAGAFFDADMDYSSFEAEWLPSVEQAGIQWPHNSADAMDRSSFSQFWIRFVYISGGFLILMLVIVLWRNKRDSR